MKKLICIFLLVIFVTLISNTIAVAEPLNNLQPENVKTQDEFQKKFNSIWYREMSNDTYSGDFNNKVSYNGSPSYRIELRHTDPNVYGSKRSEIAADPVENLSEYTYSFSVLLPKGGTEDYALDPQGSEIIAQWHNTPDQGEPWTTPPLALRTYNGRYVLERCWDDEPITSDDQMTQKGNRASYDLGSYEGDKGKFVTWKFHVKWGWLPSQDPILEVYKDGVKVLDLNGLPNTTNDKVGNYMKLGIYKWDWAQDSTQNNSILTSRVIYFSNMSTI